MIGSDEENRTLERRALSGDEAALTELKRRWSLVPPDLAELELLADQQSKAARGGCMVVGDVGCAHLARVNYCTRCQAREACEETRRVIEALGVESRFRALKTAVLRTPFGWSDGKVRTTRRTTDADIIEWLERILGLARGEGDGR